MTSRREDIPTMPVRYAQARGRRLRFPWPSTTAESSGDLRHRNAAKTLISKYNQVGLASEQPSGEK